jgi:hypothetical protein
MFKKFVNLTGKKVRVKLCTAPIHGVKDRRCVCDLVGKVIVVGRRDYSPIVDGQAVFIIPVFNKFIKPGEVFILRNQKKRIDPFMFNKKTR